MDDLLTDVAARALLGAGATGVERAVLATAGRAVHIFLTRLLTRATALSSGSHRSSADVRDLAVALAQSGIPLSALQCDHPDDWCTIEPGDAAAPAEAPEFSSVFATPTPQLPHAPVPRFPPMPAAHLCQTTPIQKAPCTDYIAMRRQQGKERVELQTAMNNLSLRRHGGIAIEGHPELRVLVHTRSPPYLALHNPGK